MAASALGSNLCTIIVPVAPHHIGVSERAIASASTQTVPCGVVSVVDYDGRGAGWARNRGVERAHSAFVVFLDADDTLRPDFLERTLDCYQRGRYVYVDDWQGESLHQTEDCAPYHDGTWHTVTTLLPTALFQAVGGFDESLPGVEDLDLYLKLQAHGVCGIRCPHPLLHYSGEGKRSKGFQLRTDSDKIRTDIYTKWSGSARHMCNCTGTAVTNNIPVQDGDVLARALYSPRQMIGAKTGRIYPKPCGFENYTLSVDPQDIEAMPGMWERVQVFDPVAVAPAVDTVMQMAREAMENKHANV